MKSSPATCPACQHKLAVEQLACPECATKVAGQFDLPVLLQLNAEQQDFLLRFVKSSGSLKEMAKQLNYSYPKVRNMLDELIATLKTLENETD